MKLKEIINKSVYGTNGYISSLEDFNKIEQYILYNLDILLHFKQIIVATNYNEDNKSDLIKFNSKLWKNYFPNCILIDSEINRGPAFGAADLDNLLFDYCKLNNIEWLCKSDNDIILQETLLDKEVEEAYFYYLNGISYEDLYLSGFDYEKIYDTRFFPQTWFYFLNISKCDYLNNKIYLDETYKKIKNLPNYNYKPWDFIKGWSCEEFLRQCIERNNLKKFYLLNKDKHNTLCETVNIYKIGDPSHKNIMIDGICHFQYPEQNIIEI